MSTSNVHAKPAVAAGLGVVVSALIAVEGFFHTGTLPSGATTAAIITGGLGSVASVSAFIGHHLGWLKAAGTVVDSVVATETATQLPPSQVISDPLVTVTIPASQVPPGAVKQ